MKNRSVQWDNDNERLFSLLGVKITLSKEHNYGIPVRRLYNELRQSFWELLPMGSPRGGIKTMQKEKGR
jgi:hypothetical protein